MEACFANKLATGKFSMGSNEPLGKPTGLNGEGKAATAPIDLDFDVGTIGATTPATTPATTLLHLLPQITRGRGHLL